MSEPSKLKPFPVRADVERTLVDLIDGKISRAQAEDWALKVWNKDLEIRVTDWPAWEAVKHLTAAGLKDAPDEYAYERVDFQGWLARLRSTPAP